MKKLLTRALLLGFVSLSMAQCASREDEDYIWLLAVLQPVAPVENSTLLVGGGEGGTSDSTTPPQTSTEENPPQPDVWDSTTFSMTVNDIRGTDSFLFETTTEYPLRIQVRDPINPVSGSMVQIIDLNPNGSQTVIFRATTDESGNLSGSFIIPNREDPRVILHVIYQGEEHFFEIHLSQVIEINRDIYVWLDRITSIENPDRDGDRVPNHLDDYPDDPTRATRIQIPHDSFYSIAYEDLYPTQGDADFNDYVVRVINEEDLNAQGKVVRIRGRYTHVAKGAGYNHTLHLKMPSHVSGTYTLTRKKPNGTVYLQETKALPSTGSLELLPASNTTLAQSNTALGQTLILGDTAEWELILSEPVTKQSLGKAPYDLYIYVLNTKREIHFLGHYKKPDGSDQYLDSAGFPWALLVPENFHWPLEKKNIHDGYPDFHGWYSSQGANYREWYKNKIGTYLFPY